MNETIDTTAWSALLMGLTALFAGIGGAMVLLGLGLHLLTRSHPDTRGW